MKNNSKPTGGKIYNSIPHLKGSKLGKGEYTIGEGEQRICTEAVRDRHDLVIVQEKYDGSNVGILKKDGQILALTRKGYLANTSPFAQHRIFSRWVEYNKGLFGSLLNEGELLVGEWLLQIHSTRYNIQSKHPFIAFDLFYSNGKRLTYDSFIRRIGGVFETPRLLHYAYYPLSIADGMALLNQKGNSSKVVCDKPEGLVYRVERGNKVLFLAKYVRHDFKAGEYLPDISGDGINCYNFDFWDFPFDCTDILPKWHYTIDS